MWLLCYVTLLLLMHSVKPGFSYCRLLGCIAFVSFSPTWLEDVVHQQHPVSWLKFPNSQRKMWNAENEWMKVRVGNAPSKSQYISEMFGPCVNGSLIHREFLKSIMESSIVKKTSVLFMARCVLTQCCEAGDCVKLVIGDEWQSCDQLYSPRLHALCPLSQMLLRVSKIWGNGLFSPNFQAYIYRKHCKSSHKILRFLLILAAPVDKSGMSTTTCHKNLG